MKFETTLRTTQRQNDNLTQLIQHENCLFKLDVHVDHSYHFQSYAVIENFTSLGTWEKLTSFDVWGEFGKKDPDNSRIEIIDWKSMRKFVEKIILDYFKYIPKTQTVKN